MSFGQRAAVTGILKHPVNGPVEVSELNLAGDGQQDLNDHGGRDKALYAYTVAGYDYWKQALGVEILEASQFGENLEVSGITDHDVVIGSRYRAGSTELVVTQPRIPCFKLGMRMQDECFPNRFLRSGQLGFYLRVITTGQLQAGDDFVSVTSPSHGFTVFALWHLVFGGQKNVGQAKRALDELEHLDEGWLRRLRAIAEGR